MIAYQQRVIDEKMELDSKLEKLNAFFATEIFNRLLDEEKDRMRRQAMAMLAYSGILDERIKAF